MAGVLGGHFRSYTAYISYTCTLNSKYYRPVVVDRSLGRSCGCFNQIISRRFPPLCRSVRCSFKQHTLSWCVLYSPHRLILFPIVYGIASVFVVLPVFTSPTAVVLRGHSDSKRCESGVRVTFPVSNDLLPPPSSSAHPHLAISTLLDLVCVMVLSGYGTYLPTVEVVVIALHKRQQRCL